MLFFFLLLLLSAGNLLKGKISIPFLSPTAYKGQKWKIRRPLLSESPVDAFTNFFMRHPNLSLISAHTHIHTHSLRVKSWK